MRSSIECDFSPDYFFDVVHILFSAVILIKCVHGKKRGFKATSVQNLSEFDVFVLQN